MTTFTILVTLAASFVGCYSAITLYVWRDNRKTSTVVEDYDDELDDLLDDLDADLEALDDLDDFADFEPSWSDKELIHN